MYNRVYKMNRCHIRRYPLRVSPNQGPYRPIRARLAQSGPVSPNQGPARRPMIGRLEEHLYHLNIREEAGGTVWVKPSSKCAYCHSNEMLQRIIHTHVKVSSKAYVYDDTIYNQSLPGSQTGRSPAPTLQWAMGLPPVHVVCGGAGQLWIPRT